MSLLLMTFILIYQLSSSLESEASPPPPKYAKNLPENYSCQNDVFYYTLG